MKWECDPKDGRPTLVELDGMVINAQSVGSVVLGLCQLEEIAEQMAEEYGFIAYPFVRIYEPGNG